MAIACPACGALNEDDAEVCFGCRMLRSALTRGTVVGGRYELIAVLGRGGMGTVYRATDRVLGEQVALKVLRAEVAGTPEMARRFQDEIRLARRITHPGVCRIHDYGEDGALRFISMELVEGCDLGRRIRERGRLPPEEAVRLATDACAALQAIHAAGIVHRDVKSANLMVDSAGRLRLMDFGIAKRIDPEAAATGYVMGSPEYMSPEQARGRTLDARSDLYSLGVVMFEMLAGRVPFQAETPVATLLQHVEAPPPLASLEASGTPAWLRAVLARALAKQPDDRFASAAQMRAALLARDAAPHRVAPVRSQRWAALAVAAVLAGAALATWWPHPTDPGPAPMSTTARVPPRAPASAAEDPTHPTPRPDSVVETARGPAAPSPAPTTAAALPAPSPLPQVEPTAEPPAATTPPPSAEPPVAAGALRLVVKPWADVSVDGRAIGQTPLADIPLSAGAHAVVLSHPAYRPFPRKVVVRGGEVVRLSVDLQTEGIRLR